MRILVAYGSDFGSTKGIAERIGDRLRGPALDVDVESVEGAIDAGRYDAFVIGSAIQAGHWLKSAKDFVRRNEAVLARRPVWLFSSGPIGDGAVGAQQPDPKEIAGFRRTIDPRTHVVFGGAFDRETANFEGKDFLTRTLAKRFMPDGDWRDWEAIERWADGIAVELGGRGGGTRTHDLVLPKHVR